MNRRKRADLVDVSLRSAVRGGKTETWCHLVLPKRYQIVLTASVYTRAKNFVVPEVV